MRLTRSVGLALGYSKKIWQLKPRLPLTSFVHFNSAQVNGLKYLKYITADNLAEESLKKLHLAREVLIYLSLAMYIEERKCEKSKGDLRTIAINYIVILLA